MPQLETGLESRSARRLTVLHLLHTMAYGGIETALINWVRAMDRERFDVHVVCFANPGETEEPFVQAARAVGITVDKIPWGKHKPILSAARALVRIIRARGVELVHAHNTYADIVGAVARLLAPVKTVTTLYVWSRFDWKRNLLQAIDRMTIRTYDQITAHCEDTMRKTIEGGIPADRVRLLICGFESNRVEISKDERMRRRRQLGVADDEILLANIARFYPEKEHALLLRCFRQIVERHPRARLWILGVGPLEAELRSLATQLGLDSSVRFLGFVEDLASLLPLIDIQVHPSLMEGVSLAICSGMAAGLPIVASDVGGLKEVLKHERNALLVAPSDEPGFISAVERILADPAYGRGLGVAARHFIENDYSLAHAVDEVQRTYVDVMSR